RSRDPRPLMPRIWHDGGAGIWLFIVALVGRTGDDSRLERVDRLTGRFRFVAHTAPPFRCGVVSSVATLHTRHRTDRSRYHHLFGYQHAQTLVRVRPAQR